MPPSSLVRLGGSPAPGQRLLVLPNVVRVATPLGFDQRGVCRIRQPRPPATPDPDPGFATPGDADASWRPGPQTCPGGVRRLGLRWPAAVAAGRCRPLAGPQRGVQPLL